MAKKIRIDFSKTEERSGWNTKHISEGLHKMKIESVQETEAGDGTAMLVYALVPADPALKTRRFPFYCKIQQNQLWKLRDLLVAAGQTVPKKAAMINPDVAVGKFIAAEVEDDTYQGNLRSQVQGTYGLDILDEDGSDAATDSEDEEEEYDEESEEAEEADEEEYEEEEEEEDEEEDLTVVPLAELRKRAKGLGVDTVGLKKAELIEAILEEEAEAGDEEEEELEDEDLEDEELADEEFEDDEEEEEEPAPKRRAAPVRKPAPKAAAAPAKRVVKRR